MCTEVEEMLRKIKRPKSIVPGDIPPDLVPELAFYCAPPLTLIYNDMYNSEWPTAWKREYQTVIPKKSNPSDPGECRNLSCTNLFSKVLETFVLQSLHSEIDLSDLQY